MNIAKKAHFPLVLLFSFSAAAFAEPAGRVLVSVGDAVVVRGGQEIKLTRGAAVEKGDLLRVGAASNLQVRFTDESVVALRPDTQFLIEDYKFTNEAGKDKSIFSLIKGGLRTITGLIGKTSRANYAMKSVTATIGIRGTNYSLVTCNNDCNNADGSTAPNGTYGGVTDGSVVASNQAGEREFGRNEYFHVATANSPPQPLLAPPSFLRDRLEGAGRTKDKGSQSVAQNGTEQGAASGGSNGESAAGTAAADSASSGPPATDSTLSASASSFASASRAPPSSELQAVEDGVATVFYVSADSEIDIAGTVRFRADTGTSSLAAEISEHQALASGYSAAAGNVYWGVDTRKPGSGDHFAFGDAAIAFPTSGIATYSHIGGTVPMDNLGQAGSLVSGGTLVLNYGSQTATLASPLVYTMPAPPTTLAGAGQYSITFTNLPFNQGPQAASVSYSGKGSLTSRQATVTSAYTGKNAEGAILGVATNGTISYSGSAPQGTATAQVYQK